MTARATRDVPAHLSVCAYAVTLCVVVTAIRYQPVQVVTGPAAPKAIDTQRHEELVRSQAKLQREIEGASDLVRELGYRLAPVNPTQSQIDRFEARLRALESHPPLTGPAPR